MNSVKTPKGTILPLLQLKGKDYLQVAHRVMWFREEKPDWTIETEFLRLEEVVSICRATIKNSEGWIIAQGTKTETKAGFPDHQEKSESGAIGRALGFLGYGTQFAQELEEGERLADAPISVRSLPIRPPAALQNQTGADEMPEWLQEPAPIAGIQPTPRAVVTRTMEMAKEFPEPEGLDACIVPFGNDKGLSFKVLGPTRVAKHRDYWASKGKIEKISARAEQFINEANQWLGK